MLTQIRGWAPMLLSLAITTGCGGGGSKNTNTSQTPSQSSLSSASSLASSSKASFSTFEGNNYPCIQSPLASGYCLVWADEFQAPLLNPDNWRHEVNCAGGGNNERQCYTQSPTNLWVDGDFLHIKAIKETAKGSPYFDDDGRYSPTDTSATKEYTSARIRTSDKADFKYGRLEIRAKLPYGQGSWPAIWMLPTDWKYGGWPLSGEIDIMEAVNLKVNGERAVHSTLHFGDTWPNNKYVGNPYYLPNNASPVDDFHTYAVEWEEGEIRFYVDNDHFVTHRASGWYTVNAAKDLNAPFNQRFHLILNLAVGGNWPEGANNKGVDASVFPQEMVVDFVRVYQCSLNPSTGKGCASINPSAKLEPGVARP